tara:strand:+ start:1496 stop:2368 length:873 start_codon:yes stop_codon:yes gene_type:complete
MKEVDPNLRRKLAAFAQNVLERHDLLSFPVNVKKLAHLKGIDTAPMASDQTGISGMLARVGDSFGILYATYANNEGFERFSISHELGHYFLEGHLDQISFKDDIFHFSHAGFVSDEAFEREADFFAAGLLLPSKLAKREIASTMEGLASIQRLRRRANASFTASSIRYAQITDDPVAVICSARGLIQFCFPSDGLQDVQSNLWIELGTAVPASSATWVMANGDAEKRIGKRSESISCLSDWFPDTRPLQVREEVVGLGFQDRIMTILSALNHPDEDDEEDLEERWTPRFR